MKSKRGFYFSVLGLTLFCTPLMVGCSNSSSSPIFSSEKTVVFDKNSKICNQTSKHSGDGSIKIGNNVNCSFHYENIYSAGQSYWQNIFAGGLFYNTTRIGGLRNLKINFVRGNEEFKFKVEWSKDATFSEGNYQDFTTGKTLFDFDFNSYVPNYFRFTNIGSSYLAIDSLSLTYSGQLRFPTYTVTTENENKGTIYSSIPNGVTTEGTAYTLLANGKDGYTFDGWYYKNNRLFSRDLYLASNVENQDLIIEARFKESTDNKYQVFTVAGENGKTQVIGNYAAGTEMELISAPNSGYASYGWFDTNGKLVSDDASYKFTMPSHDLVYTTKFGVGHNVNVKVKGDGVDPAESYVDAPSFVALGKKVTLTAHPDFHKGLAFDKWVDSRKNVVSTDPIYTFNMGEQDVNLTACFKKGLRLNVYSSDKQLGGVTGTGYYVQGRNATVTAKTYGDNIFVGWFESEVYKEKGCLSSENTYTYTLGDKGASLTARFMTPQDYKVWIESYVNPKNINETTLTYGMYPQTCVGMCGDTQNSLVAVLDKLTPLKNLYNYILYKEEFYLKAKVDAFAHGHYYAIYYPSNGLEAQNGKEYYFKVEPIVWNIRSINNGTYNIETSNALTAHSYGPDVYQEHEDLWTYDKSYMRAWLNNEFYKQAFLTADKYIQETKVDNSAASTGINNNPYVCGDTVDKVYIGCTKDYLNRDESLNTKRNSDYAICLGARNGENGNSEYCLRSILIGKTLLFDFEIYGVITSEGYPGGNFLAPFNRDYRIAVAPQMTIKI